MMAKHTREEIGRITDSVEEALNGIDRDQLTNELQLVVKHILCMKQIEQVDN